ncbi:RING/U-box superfamily protein isoform 1 [Hibiscus syriacus]|uniref:RING/U-box superfamily protein isoform 1 n=1 Tax=Hibiscus syriacus TaxID=106335 RepID=A0A6A3AB09_HIBSY|nr:uncharacterized protein LOC120130991 [Hibiscus syriacus]KAE8701123.1 RING/U-box superfamily protein isoform 1 [Hibiscus syriacus]
MPLETSKPDGQSTGEGDKHRYLNKEIKDMVSSITRRLEGGGADDDGAGIIKLAGTNVGATMRSEMDEESDHRYGISVGDEGDAPSTYVNSNFQAVNNSIMLGSSYNANDPGVHLDISDVVEHQGKKAADKPRRRGKEKRAQI